jgi:hypothetical protein
MISMRATLTHSVSEPTMALIRKKKLKIEIVRCSAIRALFVERH